nr:hypothetical protein [Tanacetum cinerariifolium]
MGDQGLKSSKNFTRRLKEITLILLLYLIVHKPHLYSFDYRVTLGFGSVAGSLDPVSPVIRLPIEYEINSGTRIGHTNMYNSDWEIMFNKWILDNFDVEEEYAKEIENPYSWRFDEYKSVFYNEIENLPNEYTL